MVELGIAKKGLRCSRCGSDDVVLVRRYSGEALCSRCLKKSLLTRMKRSVSKHGLLRRDDRILYIRTLLPYDGVLWDLFSEMESPFPVILEVMRLEVGHPLDLWGEVLNLSRNTSSGDVKVVLPAILDDLASLFLRFVFTGSPDLLLLGGRVFIAMREIRNLISPFIELPIEELWSLIDRRSGFHREISQFVSKDPYLRMVWRLEVDIPGMRFNLLRSLEREEFLKSIGIVFR